jgi:hypothetical protein
MEIKTVESLVARYAAGDESVWITLHTRCFDSEGEFLGNDGMTVNAEQLPGDVVWTQSEYLCVGYETIKFVSQEFSDGQDVTTYSVVERTDR